MAIQKAGRLHQDSLGLLKECGISIDNGQDQLKATASNFPIEILYLRNSDIPQYVEDRVANVAIIGDNLVKEKRKNIEVLHRLGFAKCRLALAIPKDQHYPGLQYFSGKKLATSYPNTLSWFLTQKDLDAEIHEISGSVEIAPSIGLADGICDLVSSGSTLFKNGLQEVETVFQSEACLVGHFEMDPDLKAILDKLQFRIKSVLASKNNKYVLLNAPNDKLEEICQVLPGMKSPTVMPLAGEGWSSVHSVINENEFWEVIDQLKDLGAEGILIVPIEKMVI